VSYNFIARQNDTKPRVDGKARQWVRHWQACQL